MGGAAVARGHDSRDGGLVATVTATPPMRPRPNGPMETPRMAACLTGSRRPCPLNYAIIKVDEYLKVAFEPVVETKAPRPHGENGPTGRQCSTAIDYNLIRGGAAQLKDSISRGVRREGS